MLEKIHRWYQGEYRAPNNEPGSSLVFVMGHYERHWTARLTTWLIEFWLRDWKWIIGTLIALSGLFVAFKRL